MPTACSSSSDTAWKVTYDANGNELSLTDPRNQTTYASYDVLDRPLCRGTSSAQVNPCQSSAYATFFYDSYDNSSNAGVTFPSGCTAPSGTSTSIGKALAETFSGTAGSGWRCSGYDARGQSVASTLSVTADSQTTTQSVTQSYNDAGEPTTFTYPDGEIVASNYDSNGYFRSMGTANGNIVSAVQYTNAGQLAGMTLGGVIYQGAATTPVQLNLGYDGIQRPTSLGVSVGGTSIFSQTQTFDNVDNVLQLSTTLPTSSGGSRTDNQSFCYDALDRLTWAGNSGTPSGGDHCGSTPGGSTTPGYQQSFTYDALDRLTVGTAGSLTYGDASHVHAVTSLSSVPNQYASYDAMGNMTCRNVDSSGAQSCASGAQTGATMSYDNEGRLASWTAPGGTTASDQFLYDNEGNRVLQRSSTTTGSTTAVSDTITFDGYTDTTISNGTTTTTKYYRAGGQNVAETTGTAWYYLVPDLLGSATLALKSDGTVQAMQLYAPYGSERYSDGTMPTAHNFTGQRLDSQTGLLYYNARYYDPVSGRFTSADSVLDNTVGMDPYAYVGDNPETWTDPTGQFFCALDLGCIITFSPPLPEPKPVPVPELPPIWLPPINWFPPIDWFPPSWDPPLPPNHWPGPAKHPPVVEPKHTGGTALPPGWSDGWTGTPPQYPEKPYAANEGEKKEPEKKEEEPGDRLPVRTKVDPKTRGVLVRDDGTETDVISGKGGPADGMPADAPGMRSEMQVREHAEAQAAALMRERGIQNADLYINNVPCEGIMGCNQMLPHMLPEGAELTVHFKDETKGINDWIVRSYTGLPDSQWQWPLT